MRHAWQEQPPMARCFLENLQMQECDRQRPTNSSNHGQLQGQKGEKGASAACEDLLTTSLTAISIRGRYSHENRHHLPLGGLPLSPYFLALSGPPLLAF